MTLRHPYHPESHTTESAENLHHNWEVQNILLDPPQSSVITSMSTEGIMRVQPSFLARGTAGLKGSIANASDFIINRLKFNVSLTYWTPGHWVTWRIEFTFKFLAHIFLEEKKAILKLSGSLK